MYLCSESKEKNMSDSKNPEEFYANLKKQLQDTALWPSEYLYKFIVPTKGDKIYDEIAPTNPGTLALMNREPLGVIGAVTPWNFPLAMAAWKMQATGTTAARQCACPTFCSRWPYLAAGLSCRRCRRGPK